MEASQLIVANEGLQESPSNKCCNPGGEYFWEGAGPTEHLSDNPCIKDSSKETVENKPKNQTN